MKDIGISRIITDKRRARGITQDQLAAYIGVSKASVSKWETGTSYPDITFLPQLAAYFDISIDTLMGYTPQMDQADIKKLYHRLSAGFSQKPLDEVLNECRQVIKKYYSCFPLLLQMAVLFCNHHMLAENPSDRVSILEEATALCKRIQAESSDIGLSKEAESLEATCYLMLQQPQSVFDLLGETIKPLSNDDAAIAQAYAMMGNTSKADQVLQISVYQHVLSLVSALTALLQIHNDLFEEILQRALSVAAVFQLEKLHPNSMLLLYYSGAQGFSMRGNDEEALNLLQKYTELCVSGFFPYKLHGDPFFNAIEEWFSTFDLGSEAPRSEQVIKDSMLQGIIQNPAFVRLAQHSKYCNIIDVLTAFTKGNAYEK